MRGVSRVFRDSLESPVSQDQRDLSDPEERRAVTVLRGCPGQRESEGLPVCQASQEHQDFQVCLDRMDHQGRGACQAATEQRVIEVTQDLEVFPEPLDFRGHLVYLDLRETQGRSSRPIASERRALWGCPVYLDFLETLDLLV